MTKPEEDSTTVMMIAGFVRGFSLARQPRELDDFDQRLLQTGSRALQTYAAQLRAKQSAKPKRKKKK